LALGSEFIERQAGINVNGVAPRESLPSTDRDIDKLGIDFERIGMPAHSFGREDGGPGPAEGIQNDIAAASDVFDCVRNERDRFNGGMEF
jgi:hypothetical protein